MLDTTGGFGGGNIAVLAGKDGIVLVDSMLAATAPKVQAVLTALSDQPVRYLIHTHFHGDHSGGAAVLGKGATLISHANLRGRFLDPKRPPVPAAALPAVTLTQGMSLHANGEEILITHYPSGHTDNDLVVYFKQAKVAHLGDMFFFGMFPAVYTAGGGDIRQLILNLEQIAASLPVDAKVIPGHGPIASMDEFRGYIAMLNETTAIVDEALRRGQTLQQSKEAKIL
ncbi:MAG TPA: MBL fold metallo-hydrolase, partial [Burkholderiaceae bacterium]